MERRIVTYGGYFEQFMQGLTQKEQQKVKYGLLLLKSQDKVSARFVKYIRNGIYELRTLYNGNVFRVFFIFDDGNVVVLFNGFQKKTRKTPESEIELAIKIKESYYADKRSSD
jgi:phage-related protein